MRGCELPNYHSPTEGNQERMKTTWDAKGDIEYHCVCEFISSLPIAKATPGTKAIFGLHYKIH